jgi:hypothetical protein
MLDDAGRNAHYNAGRSATQRPQSSNLRPLVSSIPSDTNGLLRPLVSSTPSDTNGRCFSHSMYHTGSSVLDLAQQVMTIAVRIVVIRLVRVGCNLQDRTPLVPKPVDSAGRFCILKRNGRMHRQESGNPFYRKSCCQLWCLGTVRNAFAREFQCTQTTRSVSSGAFAVPCIPDTVRRSPCCCCCCRCPHVAETTGPRMLDSSCSCC